MLFNYTQQLIRSVATFLIFLCLLIFLFEKTIPPNQIASTQYYEIDTTTLFQKKVITNRLPQFIQYLQENNIPIQNKTELLFLLSNPNSRKQIAIQLDMNANVLLLHAEIADLMQIEMTEIDAQILHFSQRNYQNPFTGETLNLQHLAEADAERILQDIGGWLAGKEEELLEKYKISLEEVESWISQANAHSFKIFAPIP